MYTPFSHSPITIASIPSIPATAREDLELAIRLAKLKDWTTEPEIPVPPKFSDLAKSLTEKNDLQQESALKSIEYLKSNNPLSTESPETVLNESGLLDSNSLIVKAMEQLLVEIKICPDQECLITTWNKASSLISDSAAAGLAAENVADVKVSVSEVFNRFMTSVGDTTLNEIYNAFKEGKQLLPDISISVDSFQAGKMLLSYGLILNAYSKFAPKHIPTGYSPLDVNNLIKQRLRHKTLFALIIAPSFLTAIQVLSPSTPLIDLNMSIPNIEAIAEEHSSSFVFLTGLAKSFNKLSLWRKFCFSLPILIVLYKFELFQYLWVIKSFLTVYNKQVLLFIVLFVFIANSIFLFLLNKVAKNKSIAFPKILTNLT